MQNFGNVINTIISNIDMIDYIEDNYGVLFEIMSNNEYRTNCPFPSHRDDTPSFDVNREKQKFICRGCSKGGTLIAFVMFMENITSTEAIKRIIETSNISINNNHLTAYDLKHIDYLVELYINKPDVSPLPFGLSELAFGLLINEMIDKYCLKRNKPELKEVIYKQFDQAYNNLDYKAINVIYDKLLIG